MPFRFESLKIWHMAVVSGGFRALDEGYIDQNRLNELYAEGEMLAKSINAFRRTLKQD